MKDCYRYVFRVVLIFLFVAGSFSFAVAQESAGDEDIKSVEEMFGEGLSEEDYYRADRLLITVATKTAVTEADAPSIVSVITAKEIRNMGARNIVDVLRKVPGFDFTDELRQSGHRINVRGLRSAVTNDKLKIMINGHSMSIFNGSPHVHFNRIPIRNVKQIEIIRGPGSALYGTGAFIGVINLVTKEGGDELSSISFEAGSYSSIKPSTEVSHKKDDFKAYIYADLYDTDGYEEQIESDRFPAAISAAPGDTTAEERYHSVFARLGYKGLYFDGFFQSLHCQNTVGSAFALTDEDNTHSKMAYGEIGYKKSITENGNLSVKGFYDYGKQDYFLELFSEETTAGAFRWDNGEGGIGSPRVQHSMYGGEVAIDYELIPGLQFVGGTSYEFSEIFNIEHYANANIIGAPLEVDGVTYAPMQYLGGIKDISENGNWLTEADRTVYAFYGQGIFDLKKMLNIEKGAKTLTLTMGVRYDDYDDVGSTTNPRFGLVYAPVEDLYFKILYGTAFRAPGFRETNAINNPAAVGNPDLSPETIETMEGLIGYNFGDKVTCNLTYFNIQVDDIIQSVNGVFTNRGKMESSGVEAEVKLHISKDKYGYFNVTYQDVRDTTQNTITSGDLSYTQDDFDPGSAEYMANLGFNFDIIKYINANVSVNYVGERDRSEEKTWADGVLVNVDNRDPVDERYLLNTSLTFRNFVKGLSIQISGFNLLDDDHIEPDYSGFLEKDVPAPGRSFTGRISYSF